MRRHGAKSALNANGQPWRRARLLSLGFLAGVLAGALWLPAASAQWELAERSDLGPVARSAGFRNLAVLCAYPYPGARLLEPGIFLNNYMPYDQFRHDGGLRARLIVDGQREYTLTLTQYFEGPYGPAPDDLIAALMRGHIVEVVANGVLERISLEGSARAIRRALHRCTRFDQPDHAARPSAPAPPPVGAPSSAGPRPPDGEPPTTEGPPVRDSDLRLALTVLSVNGHPCGEVDGARYLGNPRPAAGIDPGAYRLEVRCDGGTRIYRFEDSGGDMRLTDRIVIE